MKIKCLEYMKNFKCIGGACTDNCCVGWDVDLDIDTYSKYKNSPDSPLNKRFESDVIKNENSFEEKVDYGQMILKYGKKCPFLNDEMMCDIQICHGEDYLSKVCNGYPRILNMVDKRAELSATISCPEVARMILTDKNSLNEIEIDYDISRLILRNQVNTEDENLKNHPARYFNELREIALELIKNREYSFTDRVRLLGFLHNELLPLHAGGKLHDLPDAISSFRSKLSRGHLDGRLRKMKPDYNIQVKYFAENTVVLDNDSMTDSQSFGRLLKLAKKGLGIQDDTVSRKHKRIYAENMVEKVDTFFNENMHILENYIVNFMYSEMYPFSEEGDPYAGYTMLVIRIFLLKAVFAGLCASGKNLDIDYVIFVIQSFSKTLEHHKTYTSEFLYYMMEAEEDDLQFLMRLI
ncbi:MAG: flagellin lysine-N-methylase [Firmicutes bacterium]|nr:flagellin lysine-N-methylase [Bacillota bacterium]